MQVRVNGSLAGRTMVTSTAYRTYTFTVAASTDLTRTPIEVLFDNASTSGTARRSLAVRSVSAGGRTLTPSSAVYDLGNGWTAGTDGLQTHAGTDLLTANGALRWNTAARVTGTPRTSHGSSSHATRSTLQVAPAAAHSAPPAAATAAGFTTPAFDDEFDSADSIDLTGTGVAGKKWYTDRPFGHSTLPASLVSVSNGALTVGQNEAGNGNFGLSTISAKSRQGTSFGYGYYEARIKFNPADFTRSDGWPAFWMLPAKQLKGGTSERWSELDAFEAVHEAHGAYQGEYAGTLWEWTPTSSHADFGNNYAFPANVDWSAYHSYGVLWERGRVSWYFDGTRMFSQTYGATSVPSPNTSNLPTGTFSALDTEAAGEGQGLILGTGAGIPMTVDWVRVYR